MNETLIHDSVEVSNNFTNHSIEDYLLTNWWVLVALSGLLIVTIIAVKYKLKKINDIHNFKNEAIKNEIDFNNIINSSFNSIDLFNELKIKCHPDRFPNDESKSQIAEEIFKELSKNKTDFNRLNELKQLAIKKLNITF
jgi:hypothetical protein